MSRKDVLTKILAITGTVLAWFPIVAPIFLTVIFLIAKGLFRFDFLMPAELFWVALVGGGLLIWAALRAHSRQKLIIWSLIIAIAALASSQGLAVLTGLASGEREASGWPFILVLTLLAIFILALVVQGIGGAYLLRDLYKKSAVL
ncbi:MAG: hypothetical protein H6667_10720 [Ardenticatenaceae bacterium]|nr:hypothetical protein [Ardenticatenaceae bacterium]